MKKRPKISRRKISNILFWGFLVLVLILVLPAIFSMDRNTICNNIDVKITPETNLFFVDQKDVIETLKESHGLSLKGESKKNFDLNKMESALIENGYLEKVNVFQKLNGDLVVEALQKIPVVRIINKKQESYYLDKKNKKIPYNNKYAPRLIVATGNISESYSDSTEAKSQNLIEIGKVVQFIIQNKLWKAQIEQIYVDKLGLIYLIPKIGNHTIVIGNSTQLDEKFSKLLAFYKSGLGTIGWDKYKSIDLRFKNQVVAKKRN